MKQLTIPSTTLHSYAEVLATGPSLADASAAVIMVHGRGGDAQGILDLTRYLPSERTAFIAPQAKNNTWYPLSLLAPIEQNEPWLSAALDRLTEVVDHVSSAGIPDERIMLLGFSQGASLSLEWTARSARPIGGVFALSGGIIGPPGFLRTTTGTIPGTTVFIGCSDVDPHIPKERLQESAALFRSMEAAVTLRLYHGMAHTINQDELTVVADILQSKETSLRR